MVSKVRLILATSNCVAICEPGGDSWRVAQRELMGNYTTCVLAEREQILVGTRDGIFKSTDGGDSWRAVNSGLNIRHIRWLAAHPEKPERIFAGSEPAGIYLSLDRGSSWHARPEVEQMRADLGWYLPYSPEAGCVRGFAFSGSRVYAAVEVGGTLVSDNYGNSWQMSEGAEIPGREIHPDVHSIAAFPGSEDLVAAPTGGGFYYSEDGGWNWENRYPNSYCRAFWWDSKDAKHMLLGSADWVDRNGRIEETRDGGITWGPASKGLDVPWSRHMVERFVEKDGELLAVLSNGQLLITPLDQLEWRRILSEVVEVKAAGVQWINN